MGTFTDTIIERYQSIDGLLNSLAYLRFSKDEEGYVLREFLERYTNDKDRDILQQIFSLQPPLKKRPAPRGRKPKQNGGARTTRRKTITRTSAKHRFRTSRKGRSKQTD